MGAIALFDDLAAVDQGYEIAEAAYNCQIVADEEVGQAEAVLQL